MTARQRLLLSLGLLAGALCRAAPAAPAPDPERVLEAWSSEPATWSFERLETVAAAGGWLEVRTDAASAEVVLPAPPSGWQLEAWAGISVAVRNHGAQTARVTLSADDGQPEARLQAGPLRRGVRAEAALPAAGETRLLLPLQDSDAEVGLSPALVAMVGLPHEFVRRGVIEARRVRCLRIQILDAEVGQHFSIGPVVARGTPAPLRNLPAGCVFPLVDEYGQYRHRDWPGKILRDTDFAGREGEEARDLAVHGRPADWNRYGGWSAGPRREATGYFRVEKIDGVWWFIDPEGRFFWSHGVVRVGTRIRVGGVYRGTPLPGREHYFQLPPQDSPLAAFFGGEPPATRGHYAGRGPHLVYDHLEANLFRKYGPQWAGVHARKAQRRLASWGLNTIANSSDPLIWRLREAPYTAIVYSAPLGHQNFRLEGSHGNWGKLPDPFDPGWRAAMDETLRGELKDALDDPWCLGFFVDNELNWSDPCQLAEATLVSPSTQPAKRALRAFLQEKYPTIQELNEAWAADYVDWDAWSVATTTPPRDRAAARADLESFSERYLETYFQACRDTIKAAAPHHLYLGCRFAQGANRIVMRVAARYCDVISINRYATTIADLHLPVGLDRPILIGEFHFGALDRGGLAAALVPVADQDARATAYRAYVESALRNPRVVGTHWFQYFDQPATGRFDGENYQTGLVDICDTPYPETIAAVRRVASRLYPTRAQAPH